MGRRRLTVRKRRRGRQRGEGVGSLVKDIVKTKLKSKAKVFLLNKLGYPLPPRVYGKKFYVAKVKQHIHVPKYIKDAAHFVSKSADDVSKFATNSANYVKRHIPKFIRKRI